jgi:hypothetical protein
MHAEMLQARIEGVAFVQQAPAPWSYAPDLIANPAGTGSKARRSTHGC